MNVKRRRRAIAALAMLIATGVATFEPQAGEFHDAIEHYGSVQATPHAADAAVSQVTASGRSQDSQHIKGFDHCSHAHGCAVIVASTSFATERALPQRLLRAPSVLPPDAPSDGFYHPPRA